ncbi:hypothetical protein SKAU_G00141230 [Synaphobranchus kaupii]|uniref:Uncharacterized protein n=1 Tax=Synaphobranchus kaupii TaxID=118154 RepID=A0A9Q1FT94_SYNKA|nr:hypothetical protein SKAU_G00141230 [Synaphobranchus kaupii]
MSIHYPAPQHSLACFMPLVGRARDSAELTCHRSLKKPSGDSPNACQSLPQKASPPAANHSLSLLFGCARNFQSQLIPDVRRTQNLNSSRLVFYQNLSILRLPCLTEEQPTGLPPLGRVSPTLNFTAIRPLLTSPISPKNNAHPPPTVDHEEDSPMSSTGCQIYNGNKIEFGCQCSGRINHAGKSRRSATGPSAGFRRAACGPATVLWGQLIARAVSDCFVQQSDCTDCPE